MEYTIVRHGKTVTCLESYFPHCALLVGRCEKIEEPLTEFIHER